MDKIYYRFGYCENGLEHSTYTQYCLSTICTLFQDMDGKKRYLIGYFEQRESPEYSMFKRVASNLKDDCVFMAGFGDVSRTMHPPSQSIVAFRPNKARSNEDDETFTGNLKRCAL